MKLLNSQKNTLFDLIEKFGLSPSQFEFKENHSKISNNQLTTDLILKNSNYFFSFETGPNTSAKHYAIFCPGSEAYTESQYPGDWVFQLNYVEEWLANLVREINSPNKWSRLDNEIASIGIKFENDENKFSFHEYEDLKQKISTLKDGIINIGLLPTQINAINLKLDNLTELAKDMNKFDWKSLFIGTIISIIIQLYISPDNAKMLWTLIKQVFNNYLLP